MKTIQINNHNGIVIDIKLGSSMIKGWKSAKKFVT